MFGPYKAFDTVALVSKLKNQGASVRDKVTPDRATVLVFVSVNRVCVDT